MGEQEQDSTWLDIKIQCKTRPVNPMLAIQRAYTNSCGSPLHLTTL